MRSTPHTALQYLQSDSVSYGLVNDADIFLLGIEADNSLGLAVEGADEQHGDAAHLESGSDVGVRKMAATTLKKKNGLYSLNNRTMVFSTLNPSL